jgi:hypothetical protein
MATTNARAAAPRNRNPRSFSFLFSPAEERRRDGILRTAFMAVVATFTCRPEPRGPWDETNTGDLTPWAYPLGLLRNAMAAAVLTSDRETINATVEAVRGFCRELEADVTSMVPATEEESTVAIAMDETHVEGPANEVEMALVKNPDDPATADRAVLPLERQYERLGALVRRCRRVARSTPPVVSLRSPR